MTSLPKSLKPAPATRPTYPVPMTARRMTGRAIARYVPGVLEIVPLGAEALDEARSVLAASCAWDRAAEVAREKLFEPAPAGAAQAWGARRDGALVGVAAACGDR